MGLLDFFRSKPKPCSNCGRLSPGLHRVYSGLRRGEETDRLCTECLFARLGPLLRGKRVLFIEPLTEDGYCYLPVSELGGNDLFKSRVRLALASLGATCAVCSAPPSHLWIPQDDLDEEAMADQRRDYWSIPSKPSDWKAVTALCDTHMLGRLRDYIQERRYAFGTFRFPDSSREGYYW